MISANNVTLRIGKKALFEDVNIKFTEGNCYGLIGANGAGKSTFLKILSGQLDTTNGDIAVTPGQRLSVLEQDHFKYDAYPVMDVVIMGNERLYEIMKEKDAIYADDLTGLPLFCSEQGWNNDISKWCGNRMDQLHLEGSFRLSYNGSLFVKEGLGYLLTFEHLIDTNPGSGLVFRPLAPKLETKIYLIWKKYQVFTPIAERLLRLLESEFSSIYTAHQLNLQCNLTADRQPSTFPEMPL